MKEMTCAQMGGPQDCNYMVRGNNAEEMIQRGSEHIAQAHPDFNEKMKKMAPEENNQWMTKIKEWFRDASDR